MDERISVRRGALVPRQDDMETNNPKYINNNTLELDLELVVRDLSVAVFRSIDNAYNIDVGFVLVTAYMVFFMQMGFAMLTAGSIRSKNTKNVLLKNILDTCVAAIAFFLFGHSLAHGEYSAASGFIGSGEFALSGIFGRPREVNVEGHQEEGHEDDHGHGHGHHTHAHHEFHEGPEQFHEFFGEWTAAITAATIVSGAVAERASFYAYLAYAFFLAGFVHPVVNHWVWGGGFLSSLMDERRGMIDFAGSAAVHMVGGISGLLGAIIVGPRVGRFDSTGSVNSIPGHSATMAALGALFLWFGWFGYNAGSALHLSGAGANVAARCTMATTIAAASGGLVAMVVIKLRDHIFDVTAVMNGVLAGLVSVTASCAFIHPYAAMLIGSIGALVYIGTAMLLLKLKIDDPLDAFPVHGAVGFWGVVAAGLFNVKQFQDNADFPTEIWGLLYGGGPLLLGLNLAGAIIIAAWTALLVGGLFGLMRWFKILRISPEEEIIGNDLFKHGGAAYPVDATLSVGKDAHINSPATTNLADSLSEPATQVAPQPFPLPESPTYDKGGSSVPSNTGAGSVPSVP